ncbi:hypothetical protein FNV58_00710 (plasmid) [Streptomyces sp. RLB1-9]|uniref:hypothetical protein n=1 Tax=Streptomyces sp. RLB1-9 TaxID=2594454 RepID=UPI0011621620|nr:hypothetical protein [Streptomyces sp. RLB1-9]QDN94881.1 hypothetical protein FNV58_00710 [Streptomyces sp. RLB1-9]
MTMSIDDMSFNLDHGTSVPMTPGLPYAWQATADNSVTRHYTPKAGMTAEKAGEQVRVVHHKLQTLQKLMGTSRTEADELEKRIRDLVADFRAPESELATANQALLDLQKRNDAVIAECRRWKERSEQQRYTVSNALGLGSGASWPAIYERAAELFEKTLATPETPNVVTFIRQRTPGDSVRHLAGEIMKHAGPDGNIELAGIAVALRMVAADVDSLPQGTP